MDYGLDRITQAQRHEMKSAKQLPRDRRHLAGITSYFPQLQEQKYKLSKFDSIRRDIRRQEQKSHSIRVVHSKKALKSALKGWKNNHAYVTVRMLKGVLHSNGELLNKWLNQLFTDGIFSRKIKGSPYRFYFKE